MKLYRKKPVVIEAMPWTGENTEEILKWCKDAELEVRTDVFGTWADLYINTLEGRMKASKGDYIIKGVNGEFYACKSDVFVKTYEEITN